MSDYEAIKERSRARSARLSLAGRDIGDLPGVGDQGRRDACERNLRLFSEKYFPRTFDLAWSPDHLKVIEKIEVAILAGGLFALAMPRGSGKTSLCEVACVWAILYGHRNFVALIGASETHALEMLDSIKTELESNQALHEDFPEVCYPIRRMDGIANRCAGQLFQGSRTHILWTAGEIVLPTMPGSKASAAMIKVAGITGRIRGMKFKRPDGRTVRPGLVILDDPQTDESARSASQTRDRENIIKKAVLGLAGPGRKIAGVMPCTIIERDDLADRFLDRKRNPQWQGIRTQMVYAWPENEGLWENYARLRADGLRSGEGTAGATAFYGSNREAMDAGAVIAWPERFNPDELSAVQSAWNLRLELGRTAFDAEYQNDPPRPESEEVATLTADQISERVSRVARGVVPAGCTAVTAFVDVQQDLLFWLVAAWKPDFTGWVLDYGSWPEQPRKYFLLRDANPKLLQPGMGLEGSIFAALEGLFSRVLSREFMREDGIALRLGRVLVDANWGESTEIVYRFCRVYQGSYQAIPSHGRGIGASGLPMANYRKEPGDTSGLNWILVGSRKGRAIRHMTYDTNWWKTFIHGRLATAMGDKGALALFGEEPYEHQLLADHLVSEYRVRTSGRGRTVDEWKLRPDRPDNHWFDCLTGAAVAASLLGIQLPAYEEHKPSGPRPTLRELQNAATRR